MTALPVNRRQWNDLLSRTPGATVFQTYEWFESWWTARGKKHSLFLITIWRGHTLEGIAPLMMRRRGWYRILELTGTPGADYQDFILGSNGAELLPLLVRYLHQHRNAWDIIVLRNVPTDSPTFAVLPAQMRALGLGATDFERVSCPVLQISTRQTEVERSLGKYSTRRPVSRLRRLGELRFTRCANQEQVDRYLPLFFEQYRKRRHGSAAATELGRRSVRAFYESLTKSFLPQGWLHFSVLECAARPVAFHLGFEYRGRLYWYKPCFDPHLTRYSPGTVLLSFLIRDALDRNLTELDFTVGAEAFKYRYASAERINANLRVFSQRWLYTAALAVAWARRTASRWRRILLGRRGRDPGDGKAPAG